MRDVTRLLLYLALSASCLAQEPRFLGPVPAESQYEKKTVTFSESDQLQADVYRPRGTQGQLPVFLLLNGVGKKLGPGLFREHPQYAGWGRAATTVGLAGVVMESDQRNPRESFDLLMMYLRRHAKELGVDAEQVLVWSCSANASTGIPIITDPKLSNIRAGVVYYGTGDVGTYRSDVPVLAVRAGLDMEMLNRDLDSVVAGALKTNAPWSLVNYSGGRHGFDLFDDTAQTRDIINQTLTFARNALNPKFQEDSAAHQLSAEAAGLSFAEKWPQAERAYRQMLQANSGDHMAHWKLAEVLARENKHQEAIEHYQRALELGNPNRGVISVQAAKAAMQLGDKDRALSFLENVKNIRVMVAAVKDDPAFTRLREEPRFQAVIAGK